MEAFMGGRRRSRKSERKGRPKGLKNKIRPKIQRMLGKATLHYAHARFKEAKSVLTEAVMLNPCLPDTYHALGLVYDTIGNAEKAAGFYELAAEINPKDSTVETALCLFCASILMVDHTK